MYPLGLVTPKLTSSEKIHQFSDLIIFTQSKFLDEILLLLHPSIGMHNFNLSHLTCQLLTHLKYYLRS